VPTTFICQAPEVPTRAPGSGFYFWNLFSAYQILFFLARCQILSGTRLLLSAFLHRYLSLYPQHLRLLPIYASFSFWPSGLHPSWGQALFYFVFLMVLLTFSRLHILREYNQFEQQAHTNKITVVSRAGDLAQEVEGLPSKNKALSSNPIPPNNNKYSVIIPQISLYVYFYNLSLLPVPLSHLPW
jgi:hypothetical protein